MFSILWTIPALPLAGFLALTFWGRGISRQAISGIGVGSIGVSAVVAVLTAIQFLAAPPEGHVVTQSLWSLFDVGGLEVTAALRLDTLSLLMVLVVTVIGFLIHLYSTVYMRDDAGYARFFAYINLFVAAMLLLVLADNLFVLFIGWEGVGLCSYLLIGFWYEDPKNSRAATKAFLVTRIGDAAMAVGMFLLIAHFGTLHIETILTRAPATWTSGSGVATLAAFLLLAGALGKSGQLPLQVWLPDAMAGPTPVSALIHAATMVTAGVYLIARMHVLFEVAPLAQHAVAIIGAATLLLAGCAALAQRDIKRVLAYSTISQIGYMFLALGVGAYSAAMFHFMVHAIFKALLFMAAGAVIIALHHEQDMFKMGGLRRQMPLVFVTFLVGAMSLSALPLITAGFYSKDMILYEVWASERGGILLWLAGLTGAFITALYSFRMVFITFYGDEKSHAHKPEEWAMNGPLLALAAGALFAGFIELPRTLGGLTLFSSFMEHTLPHAPLNETSAGKELSLQLFSVGAVIFGVLSASALWGKPNASFDRFAASRQGLHAWLASGLGFDWLYERLIVLPFTISARLNRTDIVDAVVGAVVRGTEASATFLRLAQNGRLRWYMACMGIGAAIAIYLVAYL